MFRGSRVLVNVNLQIQTCHRFRLTSVAYQGRELLTAAGYHDMAMDHFCLPGDELLAAHQSGNLNRSFRGYMDEETAITIGLGQSSINDSQYGMAQNEKDLKRYYQLLQDNFIPVEKGHICTDEDREEKEVIHDLMCRQETDIPENFPERKAVLNRLLEPYTDDLIEFEGSKIRVTSKGQLFLRNICMAFDLRLWAEQPANQIFSMAV